MARNNGCTVKQLLRDLGDDDEFQYWIAFDSIEPQADPWLQTGLVCSTLANCHRTKGKAFKPKDFMPVSGQKHHQTEEEMMAILDSMVKAQSNKPIRGEKLK